MRSVLPVLSIVGLIFVGCGPETSESTAPVADPGHDMHAAEAGHGASGGHDGEEAHAHAGFKLTGENTQVLFTGTKQSGDNHSGGFKGIAGEITLHEGAVEAINVTIETDSLFSDADRLTGHLKNEDFFSVQEFPEMKFVSSKIEGTEPATVTGMLTMHGETAEISFPATIAVNDGSVSLTSEFKVDRTKFGMNYTGQPNDPINAEVDIRIIVGGAAAEGSAAPVGTAPEPVQ